MTKAKIKRRLNSIRKSIRAERVSYGELAELQGLAVHIPTSDLELLEAAGVREENVERYHVEGSSCADRNESHYVFEGKFPPFVVHDNHLREPVAADFYDRKLAQRLSDILNTCAVAGAKSTILKMNVED